MDDRITANGQQTEAGAEAPPAAEQGPAPAPCADCLSGRTLVFAAMFAAFAAYVAADFFTGGRLTAALLGLLGAGKGAEGD